MEDFITTEYNIVLKNLEKELKMKQMQTSSGLGTVDSTAAVGTVTRTRRFTGGSAARSAAQTAAEKAAAPVVNQNLTTVASSRTGRTASRLPSAPSLPGTRGGSY